MHFYSFYSLKQVPQGPQLLSKVGLCTCAFCVRGTGPVAQLTQPRRSSKKVAGSQGPAGPGENGSMVCPSGGTGCWHCREGAWFQDPHGPRVAAEAMAFPPDCGLRGQVAALPQPWQPRL